MAPKTPKIKLPTGIDNQDRSWMSTHHAHQGKLTKPRYEGHATFMEASPSERIRRTSGVTPPGSQPIVGILNSAPLTPFRAVATGLVYGMAAVSDALGGKGGRNYRFNRSKRETGK